MKYLKKEIIIDKIIKNLPKSRSGKYKTRRIQFYLLIFRKCWREEDDEGGYYWMTRRFALRSGKARKVTLMHTPLLCYQYSLSFLLFNSERFKCTSRASSTQVRSPSRAFHEWDHTTYHLQSQRSMTQIQTRGEASSKIGTWNVCDVWKRVVESFTVCVTLQLAGWHRTPFISRATNASHLNVRVAIKASVSAKITCDFFNRFHLPSHAFLKNNIFFTFSYTILHTILKENHSIFK